MQKFRSRMARMGNAQTRSQEKWVAAYEMIPATSGGQLVKWREWNNNNSEKAVCIGNDKHLC